MTGYFPADAHAQLLHRQYQSQQAATGQSNHCDQVFYGVTEPQVENLPAASHQKKGGSCQIHTLHSLPA